MPETSTRQTRTRQKNNRGFATAWLVAVLLDPEEKAEYDATLPAESAEPTGQWGELAAANPGRVKGDPSLPIDGVGYAEIGQFCAALNQRGKRAKRLPSGYVDRLPTEAEWELPVNGGIGIRMREVPIVGSGSSWRQPDSLMKTQMWQMHREIIKMVTAIATGAVW